MRSFDSLLQLLSFAMFSLAAAVGVPLPCSLPPRPEQPALLRVAPKDSIAFLSWSGARPADAEAHNRSERLAAEPQLQALVAQLRQALLGMVGGDGEAALVRRALEVGSGALQRPGCAFVQRMQYRPRRELRGGIVLKLDEQLQGARAVMGALDLLLSQQLQVERAEPLEVDGVVFRRLPLPKPELFVGYGELDGWFALVVGEEVARQVVAGLRNRDPGLAAHPDYAQLAPGAAVAQPCTRAFLDVQALQRLLGESHGEHWLRLLQALGLQGATAAVATAGLEGDGFCARLRLAVPERKGLLAALGDRPLRPEELLQIPADAELAAAVRGDLALAFRSGIGALGSLGGGAPEQFEGRFAELVLQLTGVRWQQDLLAPLGDQLTLWSAPSQGSFAGSGLCASVLLRDGAAFGTTLQQAMAALGERLPGKQQARAAGKRLRRGQGGIDAFEHGDRRCWWIDPLDAELPVAPAWTATQQHLLASLLPQPLKASLDAEAAGDDGQRLLRGKALQGLGDAEAMLCIDLQRLLANGYPALLVLLQAVSNEWQREGFAFDLADLPPPAALLPHLGPELLTLRRVDGGLQLQRTGTLPVVEPLALILAIGFGSMLVDG